MAHGIDVDYTAAINFLAGHGFDELRKSGFSEDMLGRLSSKVAIDHPAMEALSADWQEGKMPGLLAGSEGLGAGKSQDKVARKVQSPAPARAVLRAIQARCNRCKSTRPMKDSHEVTFKNGKQGVQGVCLVCGSKMVRFGVPH